MSGFLNLARRPFFNARPVVRTALVLWIAGVGLAVANAALFWGYSRGSAGRQAQLADVRRKIATENRAISAAEAQLKRGDLELLNRKVEFLNERIAERRFAWGRLFDRLGDALPRGVRVKSLATLNIVPPQRDVRRVARMPDRFELRIDGAAQNDEALLAFVDALFRHPAFREPKLERESRQGGELDFALTTTYIPAAAEKPAPDGAAPPGAGGAP